MNRCHDMYDLLLARRYDLTLLAMSFFQREASRLIRTHSKYINIYVQIEINLYKH